MLTNAITYAMMRREASANIDIDRDGDGQTLYMLQAIKVMRMPDGSLECVNISVPNTFFDAPVVQRQRQQV
jgi:hypothetical protein